VKSLLRVKRLQDEVVSWNTELEGRVRDQVSQLERLSRLKRFFSRRWPKRSSPAAKEILSRTGANITAVFLDLRGFTAFTDRADPDEVLELLRTYHATLGATIEEFGGTLEHFAGDGMNDHLQRPVPGRAPRRARGGAWRWRCSTLFAAISRAWAKLGHDVGLGIASRRARRRSG